MRERERGTHWSVRTQRSSVRPNAAEAPAALRRELHREVAEHKGLNETGGPCVNWVSAKDRIPNRTFWPLFHDRPETDMGNGP